MSSKYDILDRRHFIGLLLLMLMLATIPLLAWSITKPSRTIIEAYYPNNCPVPKIPRARACSTEWQIQTDANGCRIFTCYQQ